MVNLNKLIETIFQYYNWLTFDFQKNNRILNHKKWLIQENNQFFPNKKGKATNFNVFYLEKNAKKFI